MITEETYCTLSTDSQTIQILRAVTIEGWSGPEIDQSNLDSADSNPYYIYNFFGTTFQQGKLIEKSGPFLLVR